MLPQEEILTVWSGYTAKGSAYTAEGSVYTAGRKLDRKSNCGNEQNWVTICKLVHCRYTAAVQCTCSHHSVNAVHTVACSVLEVYLQPPLQIYSMYWNVSAVCTARHCRYTAVRSGLLHLDWIFDLDPDL